MSLGMRVGVSGCRNRRHDSESRHRYEGHRCRDDTELHQQRETANHTALGNRASRRLRRR